MVKEHIQEVRKGKRRKCMQKIIKVEKKEKRVGYSRKVGGINYKERRQT